jgi:hypothetical protein
MALASGRPKLEMPEQLKKYAEPVKPRAEKPRAEKRDLEGPVVKAIWDLLQAHPQVVIAVRMNSGMAYSQSGAPVYFQRWVKPKSGMRLVDFIFVLRGGTFGAVEAKEPNWKRPSDTREREQDNFLLAVRAAGGKAGFAVSGDMAQRIIES